jgi:hypothetical protein
MAAAILAGMLGGCTPSTSDDVYSIRLIVITSPDHVQWAQTFKEHTERETGWMGLYVLVKGDFSELYWGKYPSREAAEGDLRRAKSFRTRVGIQAFPAADIVPIPGTDIGPPEMNLANAKGVYTVLIATFHDVPERRRFAVDNCKDLRQKGEEAYYYHTSTQSIVTIGSFDASAVKEVRHGAATTTEVDNEGIRQILKRHPLLAENGYSVKVVVADILSHRAVKVDKHSYVIRIPRDTDSDLPAYPTEVKPATLPENTR